MQPANFSTIQGVGPAAGQSLPGTRIGQYEVIRLLGRGGMGEVHLARDLRLGRLVAIKLLNTRQPNVGERFLAEARATAHCHHENIVVIHEVGEHDGTPYMVFEYLEGQTLRQWLVEHAEAAGPHARVPPARAVELMLPVVRALVYAHDQGIVHRDLKPENVMLTRAGGVKVLDFGVAKRLTTPVLAAEVITEDVAPDAASSTLAGTLPYMSPEQLTLGAIDHRADVWAAGIMLFELLAGAHPVLDPSAWPAAMIAIADPDVAMPCATERLPEIGPLAAVIDRCLIKQPEHRTASARVLLAELEGLAPGRRTVAVGDDGSPFAGLAAFQETDAGRFFGRDRDIDMVVAELRNRPLVAVIGPSGAGKSSLIRAGVIPALKRSGEGWDAHIVRPGRGPLATLAGVLAQLDSSPGDVASEIRLAGDAGADSAVIDQLRAEAGYLGARLRTRATFKRRRIAIFVDQLEELYTLGVPAGERAAFLACVAAIADDATSPLRVLVAMRSDFLDRLTEDRRLGAEVTRGLVLLPPMDAAGMREALVRPVEASDHRFDPPALVDRMIADLAATPGALPLLQFTAARLWERRDRDRRLLTEASYEQIGGVAGALARHADAVLAGMSQAQQAAVRVVLQRLVSPERTRSLVSIGELRALHSDRELVDGVVQHLAAMRLVVIERSEMGGGIERSAEGADHTVELAHDSLIDRWPQLARWLDENQDDAAMLARVRSAARDWERSGRAAGLLWTAEVAEQARAWQARYRGELGPLERRYLANVMIEADLSRSVRRQLFGAILAIALVVAIALAWLTWSQAESSQHASTEAAAAAAEAMRARDATRMAALRALPDDPTSQLALLREIEGTDAPPPGALREAKRLLYARVAIAVLAGDQAIWSAAFSPDGQRIAIASYDDMTVRVASADGTGEPLILRGHTDRVVAVAFSPDGKRIASGALDRTVRIWNADGSDEPVVLRGHDGAVRSVAFSPDGRRAVSASADRTVRIWNADGSGEPVVLRGHDDAVWSVALSPDGQRVATASADRTVRIWSADGRSPALVLRGHDDAVRAVAWSPDGRRLASASDDRTLRVWSSDGRGPALVLRGHDGPVEGAAFSPDGQRIATASDDRTVRVWNTDGSGEPLVLRGHADAVHAAAFSLDGRRIVSASDDKTARVWSAAAGDEPRVLRDHDHGASIAFGPDGVRLISPDDRTVRVWNADGTGEPLVLRGHDDAVAFAAFSPDGLRIASASADRTARVWSSDGHGEPVVLYGHGDAVAMVAFSPDGTRVASASRDRTVRVWSADGGGEPVILRGHAAGVNAVAYSPDGLHLVSASADGTLQVWRADGRGEPMVLRGHDGGVNAAAFSPDGKRIASASDDKTVRVWNSDGHGAPVVLRGHTAAVSWVEFSPDGGRIVSSSKDGTIRLWPAAGGGEPVILSGHEAGVSHARFSPDGRRIVSTSGDHTVRLWRELGPAILTDPRLWQATSYCLPVERRIDLLAASPEQARHDRQLCVERVARARAQ